MEQSSIAPKRGGLTVQSIPAVARDIFVWIVGPRRSVNYFNRNDLTYFAYLVITHPPSSRPPSQTICSTGRHRAYWESRL